MNRIALVAVLLVLFASTAHGLPQSIEERMKLGDEAALLLKPKEALEQFEAVIALDSSHFDALRKASLAAVDLGEPEKDKAKQTALYQKALLFARGAAKVRPSDPEACFQLSLALGVSAVSVSAGERVKYAREIREHADAALRHSPDHAGALHVLAMWNAELMRLSGLKKLLARTFLGAGFFSEANWEDATGYMERSAAIEPEKIRHHLDLARIYADRGMTDKARASFKRVIDLKPAYFNDAMYKRQAETELARLK